MVEARREEIRDETTKAADEERPDPVGTVPSMRIFIPLKEVGGWGLYWRWPR